MPLRNRANPMRHGGEPATARTRRSLPLRELPVALTRMTSTVATLDALVADPSRVADLSLAESAALVMKLAGLLAAVGARVAEAAKPAPALQAPLTLDEAGPLLGMQPDTLRRRAKTDPAYRALVFDNGTDRLLFDAEKVAAFRRRRTG